MTFLDIASIKDDEKLLDFLKCVWVVFGIFSNCVWDDLEFFWTLVNQQLLDCY